MSTDPWSVVEGHLEAYDDGDLESFLESFAPDATVRALAGDEVHCEGRAAIRREYGPLFAATEPLHLEIIGSLCIEPYVAVAERVNGPAGETDALAVYRVEDGSIADLQLGYPD